MEEKKNRRLKVYSQSNGYNYQNVPAIVLKGKWLEVAGFDIGSYFLVECEKGKLTISSIGKNREPDGFQ